MNISQIIPAFNHKFPDVRIHHHTDDEDIISKFSELEEYAFAVKNHADECETNADMLIDILQDFASDNGKEFFYFEKDFANVIAILKDQLVYKYYVAYDSGIMALDSDQITILRLAGIDP